VPIGHKEQLVWPWEPVNEPDGHLVQVTEPMTSEYVPGAHMEQGKTELRLSLADPRGHWVLPKMQLTP
jgi:hypothetical protein